MFKIFVSIRFSGYICSMKKDERSNTILSETSKFFIDIAKLVFGGIILGGIMRYESINPALLFSIGGIVVAACFISGLTLIAMSKK